MVHLATGLLAIGPDASWLDTLVFPRSASVRIWVGGQLDTLIASDPWRLCTSVLLHTDLLHLFLNTTALLALGAILEPLLGRLRWASVFVLGGLGGSLVPWLVGVRQSDGASGAAFALLGAGMSWGWRHRSTLDVEDRRMLGPVFLTFTVANLAVGLVIPTIDGTAHLGGLATGLIVGLWPTTRAVSSIEALTVGLFIGACVFGWR
ncbi:MAG: rhomboid family intramembrane serine protease [Myxococcales bacterium]|nr:rhomboid family intramembrane serine protease [Myxococcales bacterium]